MPFLQVILSLPPDQRLLAPVFSPVAELTSQVSRERNSAHGRQSPQHPEPMKSQAGKGEGSLGERSVKKS